MQISRVNLVTIVTAIVLMVALTWFVTRTQTGISMRATAENAMAARLMGININTMIVVAFVLGAALAGVARSSGEHAWAASNTTWASSRS